ncbi:MAG: hypothetical protein LBP65_01825 [Puniceicoccales bacterium]|jgi:hypothetical protein|nr:hypothetical protein [Puniceicoccales bacterium]
MKDLDDFLRGCAALVEEWEHGSWQPLAPVEVLLANRLGVPLGAVEEVAEQNAALEERMGRLRLLQEQKIYSMLADGDLKDSTALLLLKNVCRRHGAEPETLEVQLNKLLGELHGEG